MQGAVQNGAGVGGGVPGGMPGLVAKRLTLGASSSSNHLEIKTKANAHNTELSKKAEIAATPLSAEQERLLLDHLSIVRYIARSIHERIPQHVELEELVGAGTLGLVDAVRRFREDQGVQFRSYAQFRVRGAILDSLRSLDWSPRELRRKGRLLAETARGLQAQLRRPPQDIEIAAALDISLEDLQNLTARLKGLEIGSLHDERGEESGEEELSFLPAKESENPLFQCLEGEARERLAKAIGALPDRERTVMQLYYFEEKTMREIGEVLGVVESRVSQIHHGALHRLRGQLADLRGGRVHVRRAPVTALRERSASVMVRPVAPRSRGISIGRGA